jgi:hypothetical protein
MVWVGVADRLHRSAIDSLALGFVGIEREAGKGRIDGDWRKSADCVPGARACRDLLVGTVSRAKQLLPDELNEFNTDDR